MTLNDNKIIITSIIIATKIIMIIILVHKIIWKTKMIIMMIAKIMLIK